MRERIGCGICDASAKVMEELAVLPVYSVLKTSKLVVGQN